MTKTNFLQTSVVAIVCWRCLLLYYSKGTFNNECNLELVSGRNILSVIHIAQRWAFSTPARNWWHSRMHLLLMLCIFSSIKKYRFQFHLRCLNLVYCLITLNRSEYLCAHRCPSAPDSFRTVSIWDWYLMINDHWEWFDRSLEGGFECVDARMSPSTATCSVI